MNTPVSIILTTAFLWLTTHGSAQDPNTSPTPKAEPDPYADEPYWYKPGHPTNPAEANSISTLPGFVAERLISVPSEFGSWTALCADPKGRLIAAAQHKAGLFRITPASPDDPTSETEIEELQGVARSIGWSQGLLYAFDSLYVTVADKNPQYATGLYRLLDTNDDDQFDKLEKLFELQGSGEHGPHNLVVSPDGKGLYLICGNGTQAPETQRSTLPVSTTGIDRLLPPGFNSSSHSLAGFALRFDPDGGNRQIVSSGLRNCYDIAFDEKGELFTFDSDMEWDLGAPWYRPTRICHIVSGSEFGWREDGAVWPEYFEDSSAPVLNIGPGSPTGMIFGYKAAFPAKYQKALFVCDWTFATIHAIHLQPNGGSYSGSAEEFLGGNGLPVTDVVIGSDGAMYFTVGGRRLGAALYRVRYVGDEPVSAHVANAEISDAAQLRRQLEAYHLNPASEALKEIWPNLGHADRAVRFAARVALEKLPVDTWAEQAYKESDTDTKLIALLALARQAPETQLDRVLQACANFDSARLSSTQLLQFLRACELALARSFGPDGAPHPDLLETLQTAFPDADARANRELARLLSYLGDTSFIDVALKIMQQDTGELSSQGLEYYARNPKYGQAIRDMLESAPLMERMHYAQMLLWIQEGWSDQQRLTYFQLIADAMSSSKGGHWYLEFWNQIREAAMDQLDDPLRKSIESQVFAELGQQAQEDLPAPIGPGRNWTLETALDSFERNEEPRDIEKGKRAFAAASCITCHRLGGEGGSIGPDLSSLGQRFTPKDILDSIINPDKAVSDQFRMTILTTKSGETFSGRIIARDTQHVRIVTNLLRPNQSMKLDAATIETEQALPVSTMPRGLLNPLNEDELLDLLAYLINAGSPSSRNP